MSSLGAALAWGRSQMAEARIPSPGREAARLAGELLGLSEAEVRARDDQAFPPGLRERFDHLVARRVAGEPMAYLVGKREFFGRTFRVDERVLIPRPETEMLVEIALQASLPQQATVLDVGTGSGCIAATLAAERPDWRILATDVSLAALACAAENLRHLHLTDRVQLIAADLAGPLPLDAVDMIVSNPPYIDPGDPALVALDVRTYEPHAALFAGANGLAEYARLFDLAAGLHTGAWMACEIGFGQLDDVLALARGAGTLELVEVREDLAGIARDVVFRRAS